MKNRFTTLLLVLILLFLTVLTGCSDKEEKAEEAVQENDVSASELLGMSSDSNFSNNNEIYDPINDDDSSDVSKFMGKCTSDSKYLNFNEIILDDYIGLLSADDSIKVERKRADATAPYAERCIYRYETVQKPVETEARLIDYYADPGVTYKYRLVIINNAENSYEETDWNTITTEAGYGEVDLSIPVASFDNTTGILSFSNPLKIKNNSIRSEFMDRYDPLKIFYKDKNLTSGAIPILSLVITDESVNQINVFESIKKDGRLGAFTGKTLAKESIDICFITSTGSAWIYYSPIKKENESILLSGLPELGIPATLP